MENKPAIKITLADTESAKVNQIVNQLEEAKNIPLVRAVGDENSSNRDGIKTIAILLGVGLVSGVLTWLIWKYLPESEDSFTSNMTASFTLTLCIASTLILGDGALSRSAAKLGMSAAIAIPSAIVLALVLGLLANSVYTSMVESTINDLYSLGLSETEFYEQFNNRNHLNRGLAWSILGTAAGISIGVASKALRRILITGAGGLAGGFLGGFIFDFLPGEDGAQVVGLMITGGAIGLAVSLLEQVTKSSWIEIVRGGMAGKQFILYQNSISIGSSPSANITLIKDPAIAPIAATIKRVGSSVVIYAADRANPISVNGASGFEMKLSEGSQIVLGSTELRFREKAKTVNDSRIVRG